jgi:hypothetical protein
MTVNIKNWQELKKPNSSKSSPATIRSAARPSLPNRLSAASV